MDASTIFILVVVAALVGVLVYLIRRNRYVASLRARGWDFVASPGLDVTLGLNVAPFGLGFDRRASDLVWGAASDGTGFRALRYRSSAARPEGLVVVLALPRSLRPDAATGITANLLEDESLHVDHDQLVLVGAPTDAAGLDAAVVRLAEARGRLLASPAASLDGPVPPQWLSFQGHADWVYKPRDDTYLPLVSCTADGFSHEARDIILRADGPLPFVRLTHRWQTSHTWVDSEGRSHTRTDNHSEVVGEFIPQFPFADLSVNWGIFGRSQEFEWAEFNRRARINATNERFASDVIHQRMMEYLLSWNAPAFSIAAGRIRFGGPWAPEDIAAMDRFLTGFFARVPDHVYKDLGAAQRPFPKATDAISP